MRILSLNQTGRGYTTHFFHVHIHHDNGGLEPPYACNGLITIACLTDHFDVGVSLEKTAQALSNNEMVIDKKHSHLVARFHCVLQCEGNKTIHPRYDNPR